MISIILPTYNEASNLVNLHERLSTSAATVLNHEIEFVFVDDCSTDETPVILERLQKTDDRIKIIRFARNCGSHAAVAAGIYFCRGEAAIMLAADLQDPPEIMHRLIEQWESGFKVVWGVREKRQGESFSTRAASKIYYFLMNHLTDISQPPTGADVFLADRAVISAFKNISEKNTSVYMLIAWLGYPQSYVEYVKEPRLSGTSKWSTSKRLKLFYDSLVSFSYIPLRLMSLIGAITAFLGFLYSLIVFFNAIGGIPVQGWSSLIIVVLLLGGFQMSMLGMLGEYLWRTYDETRGRPRYVIEKNTLLEGDSSSDEKHKDG